MQSICGFSPSLKFTPPFSNQTIRVWKVPRSAVLEGDRRIRHPTISKSCPAFSLSWVTKEAFLSIELRCQRMSRVCAANSHSGVNSVVHKKGYFDSLDKKYGAVEPFRGKSGSVSFYGISHQLVEESKLVSSPSNEGGGSLLWVLAPTVLMLSLILPPLFISGIVEAFFKDALLADLVASLSCEAIFCFGVSIFVLITERVQRPYLQFSTKRWGLITGLKGHLSTLFFSMGFKVVAPLVVTYIAWPILGTQALIPIVPLLFGFLAQLAIESFVDKQDSSCWPIVPIIFEVYRLYQLTRAAHFVDGMMFMMRGAPITPQLTERSSALVAMSATFQAVGLVCLWSLLTFLLRLFPSRPVAEKY